MGEIVGLILGISVSRKIIKSSVDHSNPSSSSTEIKMLQYIKEKDSNLKLETVVPILSLEHSYHLQDLSCKLMKDSDIPSSTSDYKSKKEDDLIILQVQNKK